MQKSIYFSAIFFLSLAFLAALFPYPIFSNHTNISEKEVFEINNYRESEIQNETNSATKILDMDWESIDYILPNKFEIIDIESNQTFEATRVGGKNHADIVPDKNIYDLNYKRHSVLVKLNENTYLPASLCAYPHGYEMHMCLHFKGSTLHFSSKPDSSHQRAVKKAKQTGKAVIE